HAPGNDDWFKFQLGPGAVAGHWVRLDFRNAKGDLDLELYDSGGNRLAASTGIDDFEQVSLAGRPAATYFVHVFGVAGATNPDYTLTINAPGGPPDRFESPPNEGRATATELGPFGTLVETNLSIAAPGDEDWFKFE